jgi:5-methylcytosine-specific restriction endonuclease McrA
MRSSELWEQKKHTLYQIDRAVGKRQSKWVAVCSECQNERIVGYANAQLIVSGISPTRCKPCGYRLGEIKPNLEGLKLGQGHKNKTRKASISNKKVCEYRNLFDNPSKKDSSKIKMRKDKLGKRGKETNHYIDGRTTENKRLRSSDAYKQLRKSVFKRDNFSCQVCAVRGGKLEMDHIKEWCNYPELRFNIDNCRTLCVSCHSKTENYKTKAIRKRVA